MWFIIVHSIIDRFSNHFLKCKTHWKQRFVRAIQLTITLGPSAASRLGWHPSWHSWQSPRVTLFSSSTGQSTIERCVDPILIIIKHSDVINNPQWSDAISYILSPDRISLRTMAHSVHPLTDIAEGDGCFRVLMVGSSPLLHYRQALLKRTLHPSI